jgi:hypothetical protein
MEQELSEVIIGHLQPLLSYPQLLLSIVQLLLSIMQLHLYRRPGEGEPFVAHRRVGFHLSASWMRQSTKKQDTIREYKTRHSHK